MVAPRRSSAALELSPKQLIDNRLVLEARRLLTYTDLSVAKVGRRLGFVDPANFCAFFARVTQTSPGAFRTARHAPVLGRN